MSARFYLEQMQEDITAWVAAMAVAAADCCHLPLLATSSDGDDHRCGGGINHCNDFSSALPFPSLSLSRPPSCSDPTRRLLLRIFVIWRRKRNKLAGGALWGVAAYQKQMRTSNASVVESKQWGASCQRGKRGGGAAGRDEGNGTPGKFIPHRSKLGSASGRAAAAAAPSTSCLFCTSIFNYNAEK